MSFYEVLDWDPVARTRSMYHEDAHGNVTIENIYDVEPVVDLKKAAFNSRRRGDKWSEHEHVAHIPNHIWLDLHKRGIARDARPNGKLARWLNSTEGSFWKSRPGRI